MNTKYRRNCLTRMLARKKLQALHLIDCVLLAYVYRCFGGALYFKIIFWHYSTLTIRRHNIVTRVNRIFRCTVMFWCYAILRLHYNISALSCTCLGDENWCLKNLRYDAIIKPSVLIWLPTSMTSHFNLPCKIFVFDVFNNVLTSFT